MSRKITEDAIKAFMAAKPFKRGKSTHYSEDTPNTEVVVEPNVTILKLFGNEIAYRYNDPERTLSITNAGWMSDTTRERLNGIEGVNIRQSKGVWYLNGEEWDGKLKDIV